MPLSALRDRITSQTYADEDVILGNLADQAALDASVRANIHTHATRLVNGIRASARPGLMEVFLAEYGLSTREGVALMCLAEALLRVPDAATIDALIEDKIAPSNWGRHLGKSASSLVNATTWGLLLTGKVLDDTPPGIAGHLRGALKRLGEPVIRAAVARAMKEMGRQFVLGQTINAAMTRARTMETKGYAYSYDMLGEAARTMADAESFQRAYATAIDAIGGACTRGDIRLDPGISVKLSALHPRYEQAQKTRVMAGLVPGLRALARRAKAAGMGFNIDAEEAARLDLSLDVIQATLSDPELAGWNGFGVVVQAYGLRAAPVIDWIHALAQAHDRHVMVRLVKGAYWDTEIKHAQEIGAPGFPVFTQKAATDVSYISNARRLLQMGDRVYPQFATHNAHTVAAILEMAKPTQDFEFQRLHGMGERLHDLVMTQEKTRCRIYAPVGAHRDLLAYLVRRLLENGANSSFVNQIVDTDVPAEHVAADPFATLGDRHGALKRPADLFAPERANSKGWDLDDRVALAKIDAARSPFAHTLFSAQPLLAQSPLAKTASNGPAQNVINPAAPLQTVGAVHPATPDQIKAALTGARRWHATSEERAKVLNRAADLYESHYGAIFALLAREAAKTLPDAVSELREAVDFIRYYAAQAQTNLGHPRGIFACISPWNFPLAIFTGQITAALATGNAVLAKPAEETPLIAALACDLMHRAGVPRAALQLLPGDGPSVGAALTSDARVDGVVFTGSTDTAQKISRMMADHLACDAPLIAETGGLNAMIVDSTALPEQVVRDVLASAFQSAGQRCSALRCLYIQEDVAPALETMLFGAMDTLNVGAPWDLSTDVGPLISAQAQADFAAYVEKARAQGRLLHQLPAPQNGYFLAPTALRVDGINDLEHEIFGPVLHVARTPARDLDKVIGQINARGYGLTFGLHSRIDDRVQHVTENLHAGNIYVNRNQIGAVVGVQPFGGEGLSGTGPKAGGPHYLARFTRATTPAPRAAPESSTKTTASQIQQKLAAMAPNADPVSCQTLSGATGESNQLSLYQRAPVLCLGPGPKTAQTQCEAVRTLGGCAVPADGLAPEALSRLEGFSGAIFWGDDARPYRRALAARTGAILPLICTEPTLSDVLFERHICIDTTASGGNAALLAQMGE